jgi:AraC-like DNA-binding protein
MADALATLFQDVCPDVRHVAVDADDWHVELDAGPALQVAVLLGGGAGVSTSTSDRATVRDGEVVLATGGAALRLDSDGPRPEHVLVGRYDVGGSVCDRVLTGLPELIIGLADPSPASFVAQELRAVRAGRDAILTRMLDLLAVTAIRDWMEANPDASPAWASAYTDPVVGRALELIHENPGHAWTLESIARKAGSSRSALSRRFVATVGEPPMSYLSCWRLCLAWDRLRNTDDSLSKVAAQVGYANPYAFSAAFHRRYGVRPGEHRRRGRDGLRSEEIAVR